MKRMVMAIIALFMVVGLASQGFSKKKERSTKAFTINPLAMILNIYTGSFELAIIKPLSVKLDFLFSPNVSFLGMATDISLLGFTGHARLYPFFKSVNGLWADVGIGFDSVAYLSQRASLFNVNASVGVKWVLGKSGSGLYLEPWVGYEQYFTNPNDITFLVGTAVISTGIIYGLGIGWAW